MRRGERSEVRVTEEQNPTSEQQNTRQILHNLGTVMALILLLPVSGSHLERPRTVKGRCLTLGRHLMGLPLPPPVLPRF